MNSPIVPMEPILARELKDQADWTYQVKWDGVRLLCHLDNQQIWLWNKRLHQRSVQYPELQQATRLLKASSAIIDGEAVVIKNQRPSFPAIMSRDNSRSHSLIRQNLKSLPVEYMIFDLLYLNGRNLCYLPLSERRILLEKILICEAPFNLVEDFPRGSMLFEAIKLNDMEGIVAKSLNSQYVSGKEHNSWFKYKVRLQCHAVIGGFIKQGNRLKSLLVGLFAEDRLYYIGRASTGLNESSRDTLMSEFSKMGIPNSPFTGSAAPLKDAAFVSPVLTVVIEFAEWTYDLNLRQPVIIGFSTREPRDCRWDNYS